MRSSFVFQRQRLGSLLRQAHQDVLRPYVIDYVERGLDWIIPEWWLPDYFTYLRAALVIPILAWSDDPRIALSSLILSSVFDILDGWLARRRGIAGGWWGKIIDPLSDKLFTLGAIWAYRHRILLGLIVAIVVGEILLALVRFFQWLFKVDPASNYLGKAKTWAQAIGLGCVIIDLRWFILRPTFDLCVAVALAALSLSIHIRRFFLPKALRSS